jgi:23S rRNA (cytidine1920-2'-O)/16S rRNA (cytidine1409-2'-O)-methyltransferase
MDTMPASAIRLDQLLVQRGLAESREKAQRLIISGQVRVNGQVRAKPGHTYRDDAVLTVDQPLRYVSRGGDKLEGGLLHFQIDPTGLVCADLGASTGGFTDCLLQHGAAKVYAIDVGQGQLHWKLRNDPRVVVMDGMNARYLSADNLPEKVALAVVDASFISLTLLLPAVTEVLADGGRAITLIKPQFEAGRSDVGKGGVVRDSSVHDRVIAQVKETGEARTALRWQGVCESPLKGPAGNVEFFAYWIKG